MTNDVQHNGIVKQIEKLVLELKECRLTIEKLNNEIIRLRATQRDLEEQYIPDLMLENNMNAITLSSGLQVQIKPFYFARVPKENPDLFFNWLKNNGYGALIKSHFEVWTTDDNIRDLMKTFCNEFGINYDLSSTIHWKTLEAWYKEQSEKRIKLPTELFENYTGRKAYIK